MSDVKEEVNAKPEEQVDDGSESGDDSDSTEGADSVQDSSDHCDDVAADFQKVDMNEAEDHEQDRDSESLDPRIQVCPQVDCITESLNANVSVGGKAKAFQVL